jgi:serine phosphatase RsbU (regulator of sigma subunit)/HAMP domain-containing protein
MSRASDSPVIPARFGFARKISLHTGLLIVMCCVTLAGVNLFQFRRTLFAEEHRSAYTVYMATVNFLASQFRSQGDQYATGDLPGMLVRRFMALEDEKVTGNRGHRTARLTLFDADGRLVCDLQPGRADPPPANLGDADLSQAFASEFDRGSNQMRAVGPVVSEGETIGYVHLAFDTLIGGRLRILAIRTMLTMGIVLGVALVFSWLFARRNLAPITALTEAAQRIRAGDLQVRVQAVTQDEVGLLAGTFNDMVASMGRRMTLMHRMQEWTIRVAKEFDLAKLYDTLAEMFERMSQARSCRLYVADAPGENLQLCRYRGGDTTISLRGDPVTRTAFEKNAVLFVKADGRTDEDPAGAVELALPLHTGIKRVGVVRIGRREDGQPFDDEILTALQTLAQLASVSIDNTRLYRELSERARFEQEMQWARKIQQAMLPRNVPDLPGYEVFGTSVPALEVGGDYYDFVEDRGGEWHFVVGDVSGKGVPAALIMSIVRSLIHTYVEFAASPGDILNRVNRRLAPDLESEMFVTMADVRLDPLRNLVRVVRAGHEPILVVRSSGVVDRIEPRGSALGLLDVDTFEQTLQEVEVPLGEHDTLLLYTDGLTETRDREGNEIGYNGLETLARKYAHLPAKEMVQGMAEEVKAFASGQDQQDDFTLVILRRVARPG